MNFKLILYMATLLIFAISPIITIDIQADKWKIPVVLPNFSQLLPMNFCRPGRNLFRSYTDCNGRIDCPDGSDETQELCQHIKCNTLMYRCDYGACIRRHLICNGIFDCADGSDEHVDVCRGAKCRVPSPTQNTVYYIAGCEGECGSIPAEDGTLLHYVCANNSSDTNLSQTRAVCRNGFWKPAIPSCTGGNGSTEPNKNNGSIGESSSNTKKPVEGTPTNVTEATDGIGQDGSKPPGITETLAGDGKPPGAGTPTGGSEIVPGKTASGQDS